MFRQATSPNRQRHRMMTWAHYFECFGVMLAIYGVVRIIIAWELNHLPPLPKADRRWKNEPDGTPIDTSQISGRVEAVRRQPLTSASHEPNLLKKSGLIEEKRRELEKRAYFTKPPPPPPEPPAHEEGHWTLIFI
jgi:hypothetical protein